MGAYQEADRQQLNKHWIKGAWVTPEALSRPASGPLIILSLLLYGLTAPPGDFPPPDSHFFREMKHGVPQQPIRFSLVTTTTEAVQGMAAHALACLDALGLERLDLLGFSLGGELGISEITAVKAHRGKAMQKMKANSLADLVKMSERLRLAV